MDRQEWLKARKRGLGGSDAAAILGLSPWKSPMDVWLDKTERLEEEAPDADREFLLNLGEQLEPVIAKLYERRTGRELVLPHQRILKHMEHGVLLASADRLVSGEKRGVELKSENLFQDKFGDEGTDQVPEHYLIQCAHYMAVYNYDAWDVALLHGGVDFKTYTIHRDLELEKEMISQLLDWWNTHVVADVPPDIDGSNAWALYLTKKHKANILPITDANAEAAILARKLDGGKRMQKALDLGVAQLENQLKAIIGDHDGIRGDFGKITWKKTKDGLTTDWEAVAGDIAIAKGMHPEMFRQYVEGRTIPRIGSRRFLFTPSKEIANGATIGNGNGEGHALAIGSTHQLAESRNS